jgi:8-oxo-dGTP pyrophosphatase MutT (NUDIX family)
MSCIASNIESLATADDLPAKLAHALEHRDPTRREGRRFAPELSYGRHFGPAPATARAAAVMVLLFRRDGRWHIPLTERPQTLLHHGGQISLPGGTIEPVESSARAAIRELTEELGAGVQRDMIGQLQDCYVYASDFLVTPWLAATNAQVNWSPQPDEVARVLELPLEVLLDAKSFDSIDIQRGPRSFRAPCIRFGEDCIWGATAIILAELAGLIRQSVHVARDE